MKGKLLSWFSIGGAHTAFLTLVFALFFIQGAAQDSLSASLKGRVQDRSERKGRALAVVALLRQENSTLVQSTLTRADGSFFIGAIPNGIYYILVSHIGYSDYSSLVDLRKGGQTDMGILILVPAADSLPPVIVTTNAIPMQISGDTLTFNTANIRLKANATIEELLSHLPGVQIDQKGVITVNGQKVEHLLIDGEDVFGGDPTIVTRNLNADMIVKVQVLDKRNSRAEFTGIDDGQRIKTVNLTLKEESKKGSFGKLEGAVGSQSYYDANTLLGSFRGDRQLVALGMAANDGSTGFNGGDNGDGLNLGAAAGDALGASAGQGIPSTAGGGVHYSDLWNGNEDHLTGNYSYGHMLTLPFTTSLTEQILPDSIFVQGQTANSVNTSDQQNFNAIYDLIADSLTAFRFSLGATDQQGKNQFLATGSSSFNDTLVNNSFRSIHSLMNNQDLHGEAMYRMRSRKTRDRTVSIVLEFGHQNNQTSGYLYNVNNYYRSNGLLLSTDTTDQRKIIGSSGGLLNGSLNFTEPLARGLVLAARYGLSFDRNLSLQSTYDRGVGKYEDYIDSLSSHYQEDILMQQTTLNLQANKPGLTYTVGVDMAQYAYREKNLLKDSILNYRYLNFAPRMDLRISLNKIQNLTFNYGGNTQQPSITQLEPVQNNNDPLHIVVGNPNLRPGFSQHAALGFNSIKSMMINAGINFAYSTTDMRTKTFTDTLGRQISQTVNVPGSKNGGLSFGINHKIRSTDIDFGLNTNLSFGRNFDYVGNLLNHNDNYNAGAGLSLGKFLADKYNIRLNSNFGYSYSSSSVNTGVITRYWTQSHSAELGYFPLPGWEINTNCYYNWRQKTSIFDKNNSTMLWNAYISKNFLNNQLNIRWRINDILGENTGISRSISGNQISETSTNIIGRYWMLSAIYRFKHTDSKH